MTTLAVLGTGIMGAPIARRLQAAGHEVRVWNRTRAKAEPLAAEGARVSDSAAEAVAGAEAVVTMVADAGALEETMTGSGGALDAIGTGALWIQMSTIGVSATDRFASLAADRPIDFVDAPVLGSKPQAEEGQLVVLASGPISARDRCTPVFAAAARRVLWVGEAGAGTRLKLVANSWVLCCIEGIAETFALARALGLDPRRFVEAIEGGTMDMPHVRIKGEAILREEFPAAFPLKLAGKDARLILDAADGKLDLPLVRATLAQFERAIELGHGDEDMAATYYASVS